MFHSFPDRGGQRRRVDGGVPDVRGAPGQEPEPAQVRQAGAAEQGQPQDHQAAALMNELLRNHHKKSTTPLFNAAKITAY